MKIEIRRGGRGDGLMVVKFEKASNYDPDKHEWVPKLKEVGLIYQTLKAIAGVDKIE
jgi:hypothetical protein